MMEKNPTPWPRANSGFFYQKDIVAHFRGRTAVLASMHGKEQAIAPALKDSLGIQMKVSSLVNTDRFGTFAGDVERPDSQYYTARLKALACLEQHPEAELAIASEGSFTPHPEAPFLTLNTEIVLLCDRSSSLEIAGYHHTVETAAASEEISCPAGLHAFARRMKFPETGLILKAKKDGQLLVRKDFVDFQTLDAVFHTLRNEYGNVIVETDLRAHRNPTRMKMIAEAAADLVHRLQAQCPGCGHPDFVVKNFEHGLPCEQCNLPTRMPLKDIKACNDCGRKEEIWYPRGEKAYAGHCDYCNP